VYIYVYIYKHIFIYIYIYIYIYVCICKYMCIYVYVYMHIHINKYMYVDTYICRFLSFIKLKLRNTRCVCTFENQMCVRVIGIVSVVCGVCRSVWCVSLQCVVCVASLTSDTVGSLPF